MDKKIEKYKVAGNVACWRFSDNVKNYPGWNICFDSTSRSEIITLLEMMDKSEWPSKKSISLSDPLELGQQWIEEVGKYFAAKSIVISNRKEPGNLWSIVENKNELVISLGTEKLLELRKNLQIEIFDEAMYGDAEGHESLLYFW